MEYTPAQCPKDFSLHAKFAQLLSVVLHYCCVYCTVKELLKAGIKGIVDDEKMAPATSVDKSKL